MFFFCFSGSGWQECTDINECSWCDFNECPCPAGDVCENTIGGFNCLGFINLLRIFFTDSYKVFFLT